MLCLSKSQMLAGADAVAARYDAALSTELSQRYGLKDGDALRRFVAKRRKRAFDLGFETDLQIADFAEACLLTQDGFLEDHAFLNIMARPLMRAETKTEWMLRRYVWPHPDWREPTSEGV